MVVRPAADEDWPRVGELAEQLVALHYALDRQRFISPERLGADVYTDHVREEIAKGHAAVFVAEDAGRVFGYLFAAIEPESWKEFRAEAGYIHDVFVEHPRRRSGAGQALIADAIGWFRSRGVTRVMLWSAQKNDRAQRLFRKLGFRPTMIEMTLNAL